MRLALAALCLSATAGLAQPPESDGIIAEQILPDEDFFRLVTCGARPGGPCREPAPRWRRPDHLTLGLGPGAGALPADFRARLNAAIDNAVEQINGAGSAIRIQRTDSPGADILLHTTNLPEGTPLGNVPGFSGEGVMGVGYMTLWWDDALMVTEAVVLISTAITEQDMPSVVLEEITQAMGVLYDIDGPVYEGVSIFSQNSNATTTIAGQDAALLRWLYPPEDTQ